MGVTVPALELFEPEQGVTLPHLASGRRKADTPCIGELRRFSVNPILEDAPSADDNLKRALRDYRSLIYRGLYELALQLFSAMKIQVVYGIATPEIYRFFTKSGMVMSRVEGMELAQNEEVRALQQEFALYWRSAAALEQQPALYRIHLPALIAPNFFSC